VVRGTRLAKGGGLKVKQGVRVERRHIISSSCCSSEPRCLDSRPILSFLLLPCLSEFLLFTQGGTISTDLHTSCFLNTITYTGGGL
jgi:hypothetical protein